MTKAEVLLNLVGSDIKALVLCHPLQVASPDGRVRPPLYLVGEEQRREKGTPLIEERYLGNEWRQTVVLDSPQSQANRLEEVLVQLHQDGKIRLPMVRVRFTDDVEVDQYTAPHRIYDAIFRDSLTPDGKAFFQGTPGELLAKGDVKALFRWAPNVLIFGGWHSHEEESAEKVPRFPRLVLLEIIGIEPRIVHRTSSRRDPLEFSGQMSLPEALKKKFGEKKKLSEVGYGTLPPTKRPVEVAVKGAALVGSISLVALRRLKLPEEAKAALLGLILLAVAEQDRMGYWLRSGATLIPEEPLTWDPRNELVPLCKLSQSETIANPDFLIGALNELEEDMDAELAWPLEPLELKPAEYLVKLFEQSRPYV